jgi:hypothetical protein
MVCHQVYLVVSNEILFRRFHQPIRVGKSAALPTIGILTREPSSPPLGYNNSSILFDLKGINVYFELAGY